jgi:ketosteroid isomerase-like protein
MALLDDHIEWREAEGNPYQPDGAPWIGKDAILTNLFARLGSEWDRFTVTPKTYTPTPDGVLVEGRYTGTYKPTSRSIDAQYAHVFGVRAGKITSFQQYVDTAQLQAAMQGAGGRASGAGTR